MSSNSYYEFERLEMKNSLPHDYSKVLEIGCGTGKFIHALDKEVEYWGVEPDENSAESASRRLDRVLVGDYQKVSNLIPDHYFDLIVCNDVLEHIEHHDSFLKHIGNKLADPGRLILSVPNVRFLPNLLELLIFKDWQYKEAGVLDKTHLRFFTRKSLLRTLKEEGWHVENIRGINQYGSRIWSPKRLASYFGQIIFGSDTAYLQFAVRARKITTDIPVTSS